MKSIMIDLETLGTAPDAAVISLGVVAFDLDKGVIASAGWGIKASDWHGKIDPATVQWWMGQSEAAREFSFKGYNPDVFVAQSLASFVANYGGDECWANDPDFDVVILRSWWERVAQKAALGRFPISYKHSRSYRTINAEAKRLGIDAHHIYDVASVAHNPIDDAANQARVVNYIRTQLVAAQP